MTVAALYVDPHGVYADVPGVDVWDEARDARRYPGPWPVVAHPPCARWTVPLAYVNQTRYGHKVGDDGGCFAAALDAVRRFGGVLEHPRDSIAWSRFGLPRPRRGGWTASLFDPGVATVVDQHAYGHPCKKETWLYYIGPEPPAMRWEIAPAGLPVVSWLRGAAWHRENGRKAITRREASATPPEFRDALLAIARTANSPPVGDLAVTGNCLARVVEGEPVPAATRRAGVSVTGARLADSELDTKGSPL